MVVSSNESKKIMCINADLQVAQLIGKVFHASSLVTKLGDKDDTYTSTSTWLKMAVLYLLQSDPSAEKLSKLYESCKSDSNLLHILKGEV